MSEQRTGWRQGGLLLPPTVPPHLSDADPLMPVIDPVDATRIPHLKTQRIQSAVGVPKDGRPRSALVTYLRLQNGSWRTWVVIWALQNVRYLPVYITPLLIGHLIDRIDVQAPQQVLEQVPWVLGVTLVMCAATVACDTAARAMLSRLGRTLTAGLRDALIRRINRLQFAFHDRAQLGALQNKFTLDVGRIEGFQSYLSEALLMYGTVVVVMLAIIASTNPLLLVVLLIAVPFNLFLVRLFWNRIRLLNEAYCTAETDYMASLNEALNGMRTTRAHATEDFVEERLAHAAGNVAGKAIRLDLTTNLFGSGSWAVATFLNLLVVAAGLALVVSGERQVHVLGIPISIVPITLGEFTVLLSYYGIISGAMAAILGGLPAVAAAKDAIRSLAQLFHEEDLEEPGAARPPLPDVRGEVRLRGVHFRYPGAARSCLEGLNLHVPAGRSLALVGRSGSGKSTVANLVLGFYQPLSGQVLIDGQDLAHLDRRSLRRHIGVVSQEVVLFKDSILTNIAWGDAHPDVARAEHAARQANALEFIARLPGGLDHVLGDRGMGLSGGQRQRLAIARALYRDPRLLILDEATSALDQESEHLIKQALTVLCRGRTTLIIAHRLSTVRDADRIVVLDDGRVAESGTFAELMALNGLFTGLAKEQLS